jgi:hypothetical protein
MVDEGYRIDGASESVEFAYKVHSILEGLGDNESDFDQVNDLREKVADYIEDADDYGLNLGTRESYIENTFEAYLEEENEEISQSLIKGIEKEVEDQR